MASTPKISTIAKKLLTDISGIFKDKTKDSKKTVLKSYIQLNQKEIQSLVENYYLPSRDQETYTKSINIDILSQYFRPIYKQISFKKLEYEKIVRLAPEIEQSALVVIPSILSPNSFRNYQLTYSIDNNELDDDVKSEIVEILNDHFNKELKWDQKLGSWIKDALYKTGAKPIIVIPYYMYRFLRNKSISFESVNDFVSNVISDNILFKNINYSISLESLKEDDRYNNFVNELYQDLVENFNGNKFKPLSLKQNFDLFIKCSLESIAEIVKKEKLITLSDRPETLAITQVYDEQINDQITQKLKEYYYPNKKDNSDENKKIKINYEYEPIIDLSNIPVPNEEFMEYPIIIEPPTEAVIPIYTKGNPSNHVGYFILLNPDGTPISAEDINDDEFIETSSIQKSLLTKVDQLVNRNKSNVSSLFFKTITNDSNYMYETFQKIFESFVDKMILNNLNGIGYDHVSLNMKSDIKNTMFSRLLRNKRTIMLFVPQSLVSYIAFEYNLDGTGRSKLEDILFPLSLKITYIMVKMFNLMEQSINTKNIRVSLAENIGNHLEVMSIIKEMFIRNKMTNLTYDPIKIIKTLADREVRIIPSNIPGINDFQIESEDGNSSKPIPDDNLYEEIKNLYILNLIVPPSLFNQLNETEYSRSVVTNNILFSKKIEHYQKIFSDHMTKLSKIYLLHNPILQEKIIDILKKSKNVDKLKDKDVKTSATNIINSIRFVLPKLRISYDRAEFEEINDFINMIENVVDKLMDQNLITDRDNQELMTALASYVKSSIIKNYLIESQVIKHIDSDLMNIESIIANKEILDINQAVMNIKKALDDLKNKISQQESSGY